MKAVHFDPALQRRAQVENRNPYGNQQQVFLAKVVAVHSDTGKIDVALDGTPYQGGIVQNVPVTSWSYGTQTGQAYLPSNIKLAASLPSSQGVYDQPVPSGEQDVWAVIAHLGGRAQRPVCIGFMSPHDSQVHTENAGWQVSLHESGVWTAISPAGDVQTGYPDGSYLLMSAGTTPVNMGQQNANWNPKTTSTPYNVTMSIKGNVSLTITGSVTVNAAEVYLGTTAGSGEPLARKGDPVSVDPTTGVGTITGGSSKVFSG